MRRRRWDRVERVEAILSGADGDAANVVADATNVSVANTVVAGVGVDNVAAATGIGGHVREAATQRNRRRQCSQHRLQRQRAPEPGTKGFPVREHREVRQRRSRQLGEAASHHRFFDGPSAMAEGTAAFVHVDASFAGDVHSPYRPASVPLDEGVPNGIAPEAHHAGNELQQRPSASLDCRKGGTERVQRPVEERALLRRSPRVYLRGVQRLERGQVRLQEADLAFQVRPSRLESLLLRRLHGGPAARRMVVPHLAAHEVLVLDGLGFQLPRVDLGRQGMPMRPEERILAFEGYRCAANSATGCVYSASVQGQRHESEP
mmetsp:Transcript_73447/g.204004  ORF Transcript_73447/g.204004 Transcript_73447/m.204004 type:complete len:319 (+) Transcript_73447:388-1344(+)